jgi:hypothetical protein
VGNLAGGSFTGDFERWMKWAVGVERLSLREFCEGNLEGAPLLGTLEDVYRKALETGISFRRGLAG